jgi:hypothetical protein
MVRAVSRKQPPRAIRLRASVMSTLMILAVTNLQDWFPIYTNVTKIGGTILRAPSASANVPKPS